MTEIINWYDKIGANNNKKKLPSKWKNHHIYHNSMILCIGGTGTGKTNSLIDYISRSSGEFYKIIICSFSTLDEPLYNFLAEKNDKIEFVNDVEEIPSLEEFDDETKKKPKLIIFDDFINLTKKEFKKINPFLISGRKYGFTVWLMAQEYTSIPKIITRNINYFILNRINDNVSIDRIIKNHNLYGVDKDIFKKAYQLATKEPLNFFMIDLKSRDPIDFYRHGFLNFLRLKEDQ
jgi:hypothetical protein